MKKIITTFLLFIPTFVFSQTIVKDTLSTKTKSVLNKVVTKTTINQELDEEYTERPFNGKEETIVITPYTGMTDHEEYNAKLKKLKPKK
jgi:hypothetical protein